MKKILTIIIFFLEGGLITFGQNAITLDPTTIGNVQSRTLSEGVGGKTDTLRLSSTGYNLYYLGMKSTTPLAVSGSIASIYGRASNATGQNVGVIGYANPSLSSNVGYGVWGNAYGDNNILVGLRGSVYRNFVSTIGGSVYGANITADSKAYNSTIFGVYTKVSQTPNDTTTATIRYGVYASTTGKARSGIYGIYTEAGNTTDTVTNSSNRYGIFAKAVGKSKQNALNIGGSFMASIQNYGTTAYGISASVITNLNDTTTANNRYGVLANVNGKSRYTSAAIYGLIGNSLDTTTSLSSRYGVYGMATGKISKQYGVANYGGYFTASSVSYLSNIYGAYFSANNATNDTTTAGYRYGAYATVNGKSKYGTYGFYANNAVNDTVTSISNNYGIFSSVSGKVKKGNSNYGGSFGASVQNYGASAYGISSSVNVATNDTTTANSRYGVYANVNGRAFANCGSCNTAIYASNGNSSDTLTIAYKNAVFATVSGKSKNSSFAGNFNNTSTGNHRQYGLSSYVNSSSNTQSFAISANSQNSSSGFNYGGYFMATGTATSIGNQYGIFATVSNLGSGTAYAGYFAGDVQIAGNLSKSSGSFKIDHPQDPENKYLVHSFVESPDMMNVYNGNIITNNDGEALVELPAYFEALNKDFRYQLTPIGELAQVAVIQKIKNNQFKVKSSVPNLEVSWQVTGIRKDPYAEAHRLVPEVAKKENEKGHYLHPELYKKSASMRVNADSPTQLIPSNNEYKQDQLKQRKEIIEYPQMTNQDEK